MSAKFRSSRVVPERGATLSTGGGTLVSSWGWLVGGLLAFLIPVIGPVIGGLCLLRFVWLSGKAIWLSAAGTPDGIVRGACPHCATQVTLANKENQARNCPSCKHRLVLRDGRLMDVTG